MAIDRLKILSKLDLFAPFADDELRPLAAAMDEVFVEAGETLFEEGTLGRDMFVLAQGTLQVFKDKRAITAIRPPTYIGEMAIIEEKPRSATITALEDSLLLRLTAAQFERYIARRPAALLDIMRTLSQRIRANTELIAAEFQKANILIHDMKNALTSFLLLDLVADEPLSETAARHIAIMRNSRGDLLEMVNEAMANAKRLQYRHQVRAHDLGALVRDTVDSLSLHPDLVDIDLRLTIDDVPPFPFERIGIRRLINNLVLNAAQACGEDGVVAVGLCREDGQAVLTVTDNGCGVPEEIRDAIFTPHFTTKENGNGLGLASCRDIVENRHHGRLFCAPGHPCGTVFTARLPLTDEK